MAQQWIASMMSKLRTQNSETDLFDLQYLKLTINILRYLYENNIFNNRTRRHLLRQSNVVAGPDATLL